jgi:hypothetical protein
MNLRPAPLQIVLALKARLVKTTPAGRLIEDSVKLCSIPGTLYDATLFQFDIAGKLRFVAEFCRPDLPHIFVGKTLYPNKSRYNAGVMLAALLGLSETIRSDRRFRPRILQINGFHPLSRFRNNSREGGEKING